MKISNNKMMRRKMLGLSGMTIAAAGLANTIPYTSKQTNESENIPNKNHQIRC